LRLTVMDKAQNETEDMVTVTVVRAIEARNGGYVEDPTGKARIYIPPNALSANTGVVINPTPEDELRESLKELSAHITPTDVAYDLGEDGLTLSKPATLTIHYSDVEVTAVGDEARLALFYWHGPTQKWQRIGGTVAAKMNRISTVMDSFGRYALMGMDVSTPVDAAKITDLTCQPRIFSPNGSGFNTETTISFRLSEPVSVGIVIYNRAGELISNIVENESMSAGVNAIQWNGKGENGDLPSDMYIVAIQVGEQFIYKTVGIINQ